MIHYKHIFFLFLASTLIISGCSAKSEVEQSSQSSPAPIVKEVESLPDADIIIPAGLVGSEITALNQSEPEKSEDTDLPSETTFSDSSDEPLFTENGDGTITYSLSGNERTAIVNELSADITRSIQTILDDDEYYPHIVSITPNEDGTVFTIALANGDMNTYEAMLVMSFYTIGDKYQLYKGIPSAQVNTTVIYINQDTGEIISQSDSTSMDTLTTNN